MNPVTLHTVVSIARDLFQEAYEGAQGPATWFVNNEPNQGVFGTLDNLTAEEASRPGPGGGPSVAAHTEHLRWSLANVNAVVQGHPWNPDWSGSWTVNEVTEGEWDALRGALRREYGGVAEALANEDEDWSDPMKLTGALAMAPHAAHHLGTIRQMARSIRADTAPGASGG